MRMATIEEYSWGTTGDNQNISLYTITNEKMTVKISTLGGAIVSLTVPDLTGTPVDVVLGYDNIQAYETQDKYIGCLIGRHANRIAKGQFTLNQKCYQLYCNDGNNHLHGGRIGFDKRIWDAKIVESGIELTYHSADGEEGYPGNLYVHVRYTIAKDNTLSITYQATADQDTVCNLTNHAYFNLSGYSSGSVENQFIQIFADHYTAANAESLPTGQIAPVSHTPLDLRLPTRIGDHIDDDAEQIKFAGGFDHNWVINAYDGTMQKAAYAYAENTGITLTAYTTLPGLQFYSGNYLDGAPIGKNQTVIAKRHGFCLESQYFPNALANPDFLQPILKKGDAYFAETAYEFGLLK